MGIGAFARTALSPISLILAHAPIYQHAIHNGRRVTKHRIVQNKFSIELIGIGYQSIEKGLLRGKVD